jgi:hypothetical protein
MFSRSVGVFSLYKREQSVFTFDDYAVLLSEAKRVNAMRVLEFGPGNSTLAWIEADCDEIISLEHNPKWMAVARDKLSGMHPNLRLLSYKNAPKINLPELNGKTFDLAFVDSPVGVDLKSGTSFPGQENCSRLNTLLFALSRTPVVLLHDAKRPGEQATLDRIRNCGTYNIEMIDTVKGMARITDIH